MGNIKELNNEIDENIITKLNLLSSLIDNIIFFDDNTVGVTLNKNLIIYNEQNTVQISKGYNVTIANKIHLNPEIQCKEIYQNPEKIQEMCDESEKNVELGCGCCTKE